MSSKSNKSMKSNNNYLVDQNKFYKIKANITGNSLVHVSGFNKDYVEYNICIKTIYGKWTFKRTYDEFCKLNNKLVNKVPEIKDLFPPKRFFKNSENTIKERVKYFNKYIKFLFNKVNIFSFDDIINFFYIEKGIIGLIIKKYNMLKIGEENYIYTSLNEEFNKKNKKEEEKDKKISYQNIRDEDIINILNNENYYNAILQYEQKRQISFDWDEPNDITPNTFVIREFINNLSEKIENKADIIQNFENFLQKQTKWIKLSKKEITELFIGYEDEEDVEEDDFNRTRTLEIEENNTKHSLFKWFEKKKNSKTIESDDDEEVEKQNKIPGLFQQIGDFNKNVFSAVGSLDLLEKLLNSEYNPDYEIYISVFQNMQIYQYNYMKLNNIIRNNIGGNKTNIKAMKLLHLIFSDKKWEKYENEIISDENVYKQYINYVKHSSE
mgnify:CR=1 FL=1